MTLNTGSTEGAGQPYMSYHQDGLLDLAIGVAVLLAGVFALVDLGLPLGAAWVVLWLPIWLSAKKSITARRAPDIEISKAQYEGLWRAAAFVIGALVLLVLAGLVVLWGRNAGFFPEEFVRALAERLMFVLGLVGALVFGVAAWLSGLVRLYVYAVLTAVAFVGGYLLGAPF
ncbi:MAG: hypothetical protein OEV76_01050, partial [Anaerolineae bacterium]|nr:hypothetical protein [Anaerolineae bacterium]